MKLTVSVICPAIVYFSVLTFLEVISRILEFHRHPSLGLDYEALPSCLFPNSEFF